MKVYDPFQVGDRVHVYSACVEDGPAVVTQVRHGIEHLWYFVHFEDHEEPCPIPFRHHELDRTT